MTREEFDKLPGSEQIRLKDEWCKKNNKSTKDPYALSEFLATLKA
jgi:hypothetical protein